MTGTGQAWWRSRLDLLRCGWIDLPLIDWSLPSQAFITITSCRLKVTWQKTLNLYCLFIAEVRQVMSNLETTKGCGPDSSIGWDYDDYILVLGHVGCSTTGEYFPFNQPKNIPVHKTTYLKRWDLSASQRWLRYFMLLFFYIGILPSRVINTINII